MEEDAVLGRGVDGDLEFGRVPRQLRESTPIPERLGVEYRDVESRPEFAEEIDQVFYLLRHLLLRGLREGVAVVGKRTEDAVLLKYDDGGRRVGAQLAEALGEVGRKCELLASREVVARVVGEGKRVDEDEDREDRESGDRGGGVRGRPSAGGARQSTDNLHQHSACDRREAAEHEPPRDLDVGRAGSVENRAHRVHQVSPCGVPGADLLISAGRGHGLAVRGERDSPGPSDVGV